MSSPAEGTAAMDHNGQHDHLSRLPTEIICLLAKDHSLSIHDLAALAATSRRNLSITNPPLYKKHLQEDEGQAMLWAVRYKRFATISRFLENGADIDSHQMSRACMDQQHIWFEGSTFWFVKDTFRSTADWPPLTEFTPLAFAAIFGLDSMVAFLLDHGANIEKPGKGICACSDSGIDVGLVLPPYYNLSWCCDPDWYMDNEIGFLWTPLHVAMCRGYESTAILLLSRGATPQETCPCKAGPWNALQTATLEGYRSIIDILLDDKRIDINTAGQWGLTALHLAYYRKNHALVEKYLARGADINASWDSGDGGWTIFAMACLDGDLPAASDYLQRGADPDFVIKSEEHGDEWTALGLIYAAMHGPTHAFSDRTVEVGSVPDTRERRLLEEQILQVKLDKAMRRQRGET